MTGKRKPLSQLAKFFICTALFGCSLLWIGTSPSFLTGHFRLAFAFTLCGASFSSAIRTLCSRAIVCGSVGGVIGFVLAWAVMLYAAAKVQSVI